MDFTAPIFLFLFLPFVLSAYWISTPRLRVYFLLGISLFFYAWGEGRYALVLCVAIVCNYLLTLALARCRQQSSRLLALYLTVGFNLAFLFSFKYPGIIEWLTATAGTSPGVLGTLHLPLGISFFTFQAIAYAVDVYHEKHVPSLNPLRISLFLSLFPKISAGPIIRYEEVDEAFSGPKVTMEQCSYGAKRFIIGLGKKLLVADVLAKTADQIFTIPSSDLTAPVAWLGIVCYTLQLYFDFSGYSDMAIGLGRMLGFTFRENFDYPYVAKSVTEFWRRWHISLSTWFRDYLYTPLLYTLMTEKVRKKIALGQYRTNYRSVFCVIFVFTLCGWWHGSTWNFVIWGMLHGLLMAAESLKLGKLLKKAPSLVSHLYALLSIMFCWVFFRSSSLTGAVEYIKALVGFGAGDGVTYSLAAYINSELLLVLSIGILAATPIFRSLRERIAVGMPFLSRGWVVSTTETAMVTAVLVVSLLAAANATYKPFIYFRF